MSTPRLGRETLNLFSGRIATLVLSLGGLFLFPVILGPEAHGAYQYYMGLQLLMLGTLNACASSMLAHYIAIYRVSHPARQGVLINQVCRWYVLLVAVMGGAYFFLPDPTGFLWVYLAVFVLGGSQLLSSTHYGIGKIGPATWFPVLNIVVRMIVICGLAWMIRQRMGAGVLTEWGVQQIPPLLLWTCLPAGFWMVWAFYRVKSNWYLPETPELARQAAWFPWGEIKRFGVAVIVGQVFYQVFTRSLTAVAGQVKYPLEQIGYLGLSLQGYGQVMFLAGIFSVSAYPWLVSAGESGDLERFKQIQSESWRLSCIVGGWLIACMLVLPRPLVWVVLGQDYHADVELIALLIQISAVAGGLMLVAEFHLRMMIALTQTRQFLLSQIIGFAAVVPYMVWVVWTAQPIEVFALCLPLGVGGLALTTLLFAPRTRRFARHSVVALVGTVLATAAAYPWRGLSFKALIVQSVVLSLVYGVWLWVSGLLRKQDWVMILSALRPARKD